MPLIPDDTIKDIKKRANEDIVDIIGMHVKLKKQGKNHMGCCPFHSEKTPSFSVSPDKGIYKCFGCGKSGSTVWFLVAHKNISYIEAIRWLANYFNISID